MPCVKDLVLRQTYLPELPSEKRVTHGLKALMIQMSNLLHPGNICGQQQAAYLDVHMKQIFDHL
jgi:hypothetical protein